MAIQRAHFKTDDNRRLALDAIKSVQATIEKHGWEAEGDGDPATSVLWALKYAANAQNSLRLVRAIHWQSLKWVYDALPEDFQDLDFSDESIHKHPSPGLIDWMEDSVRQWEVYDGRSQKEVLELLAKSVDLATRVETDNDANDGNSEHVGGAAGDAAQATA